VTFDAHQAAKDDSDATKTNTFEDLQRELRERWFVHGTQTHTNTHTYTHSLTHSLTHSHTHTHSLTRSHTRIRRTSCPFLSCPALGWTAQGPRPESEERALQFKREDGFVLTILNSASEADLCAIEEVAARKDTSDIMLALLQAGNGMYPVFATLVLLTQAQTHP